MTLDPAQLALLSRLLDEAMALPPGEREAWLAALPPEAKPLQARLARALLETPARSASPRFDAPLLTAEPGSEGQEGERVGPWRLVHLLGRGGMGTVWAAERADGLYERSVALKLPRMARSPTLATRMARERQIAARLEHPGIARLYDAGVDDLGRPYLVMERVDGTGLVEYARAHALSLEDRVRLVLQVADALVHAHRMLVVHRDIKPGNLLVDARGQVKLLDFGVARLLEDGSNVAQSSGGTPADSARTHTPMFAAPEQRHGGPVGTATDLYALALVLHELLTGSLPVAPVAARQADAAPEPDTRLPPALRAVLLRAWQSEPAERQPSVAHFADELRAVLEHRVPASWAASRGQRLQLWARRRKEVLAWGGLAAVAGLLAVGLLLAERARTHEQQARLDEARIFLTTTFADIEPRAGQSAATVTGLDLIESALQRARVDLGGQPVLQAEVLGELAVMLRRFARPDEALAVLRQAHQQMLTHGHRRDAGRHLVAAQLAVQELAEWQRTGQDSSLAQVQPLAEQALRGCSAQGVRCAKARALAQGALRNRAAALGDSEVAQAAAARAVDESIAAFGAGHAETVMARVHQALVLRNAVRLPAADQALQAARAAASAAGLRRGDAGELLMAQALLDGDLGRHELALPALDGLLATLDPGSPDIALLQRLRAQSLWSQGRLQAALRACEAALHSAAAHRNGWEQLNALQLRTRTLAAAGRLAEAERSLAEWDDQMAIQRQAPDGIQALRWQRGRAELALHSGRFDEALATAQTLTSGSRLQRPASALELAMNWDLRGAAMRAVGQPTAALQAHHEALAVYTQLLPEPHPLRLRNRLEAARATALATPSENAELALREAATRYLEVLPADSAWRPTVQALAAGQAAASPGLL